MIQKQLYLSLDGTGSDCRCHFASGLTRREAIYYPCPLRHSTVGQ